MKKILLVLGLFTANVNAQIGNNISEQIKENTKKIQQQSATLDSMMIINQNKMDSVNMESFNKQNIQNLDAFMAERKEQENKQMSGAYVRIGIGVLMLVFLGWQLVKKKKS